MFDVKTINLHILFFTFCSVPQVKSRRKRGRKLPPTPNKPSTLKLETVAQTSNAKPRNLEPMNFPVVSRSPTVPQPLRSPSSINFPRLNASPTHMPILQMPPAFPAGWRISSSSKEGEAPPPYSTVVRDNRDNSVTIIPRPSVPSRPRSQLPGPPSTPASPYRRNDEPLSFETAAAIGRGTRQLPSPLPNGYKPGQMERERLRRGGANSASSGGVVIIRSGSANKGRGGASRHSDSDDDDWC